MADQACLALEIPERLHRDNKEPDPQFEESELLYRRIAKGYMREDLRAGFSLDQAESVNRQKYSKYPADVLFNIVNGQHRIPPRDPRVRSEPSPTTDSANREQ
jgi:hypothetical protein